MAKLKPGVDFVGVGVGVMVRNEKGEMLLGLRAKNCRNEAGKWTAPGGCVEFGETLADAAKREALEEFGIKVEAVRLLTVIDHIIQTEKQHWVNPLLEARIVSGRPKIMEPDKFERFGWFALDKLPENLAINWLEFFAEVKAGKIKI
ncbi:MAG: NUDIX domain-containing protein [archaeon]